MKVTGHRLQQRIRELKAEIEVLCNQLRESMRAYPGEQKDPKGIAGKLSNREAMLARIQCAQDLYNENVTEMVDGKLMTLGFAVKRIGSIGRMEKIWRNAAAGEKPDRYARHERSKDIEYAVPTITSDEALTEHRKCSQEASMMRDLIATMNTTQVNIEMVKISPVDLEG